MAQSFKDLLIWKKSMELVTEIYKLTRCFPKEEQYGLTSQIRRAAVSIPSNIAEGKGRKTSKEFHQFLVHARGSLWEVETQLLIAENLGYLTRELGERVEKKTSELGRILSGFLTAVSSRR
jgi:four helix bundle protein